MAPVGSSRSVPISIFDLLMRKDVLIELTDIPLSKKEKAWWWPTILFATLLIFLLLLEYVRPYYFLQDDNRSYYFPYMVHNANSLADGEIAQFNFHQFMGVPSLAPGQSGALYPFAYLSVLFSQMFCGHVTAAVDIMVIVHLLIAGLAAYYLLLFFRPSRGAAFFAGLTWPLCGFVLIASNSWVIISITAAYFPWILLAAFRFFQRPSRKTFVAGLILRLLLFYGGHIQYFVYTVIFEFITLFLYVLFYSEKKSRIQAIFRYVRSFVLTYTCVCVLSLPLLLPMFHLTSISAYRSDTLPFSSFADFCYPVVLLIMAVINPFLMKDYLTIWNFVILAHIGCVTIFILFAGGLMFCLDRFRNKRVRLTAETSVFLISALLAGVWATSTSFNRIIYLIPFLNRFRWPFKLAFFLCFFLIMIASFAISNLLQRMSSSMIKQRLLLSVIVLVQMLNFWALYAIMPYADFGEHHADALPLQENLRDTLKGGRILTYGFDTWDTTPSNDYPYRTAPTLAFNYATLWGLDYFAGYEMLLPKNNREATYDLNISGILRFGLRLPISELRDAGVCWYIVPSEKADQIAAENPDWQIRPEISDSFRTLFFDPLAKPVFSDSSGHPIQADQVGKPANTIRLTLYADHEETITVRYVPNSFFRAYSENGTALTITPIDNVQFQISVPAGTTHVTIRYSDPYFLTGSIISGMGLLLITSGLLISKKKQRTFTS